MAVTRLKRKALRNKSRAKVRAQNMKLQGHVPVIKQVDVEAIEAEFKKTPAKVAKPAKEKAVAEEVATPAKEAKVKEPVAKKPAAKKEKAPAKKAAAPKAKKKED